MARGNGGAARGRPGRGGRRPGAYSLGLCASIASRLRRRLISSSSTCRYPPPLDYLNSRERAAAVLTTLSSDDLAWVIEVASDAAKLRKARPLWSAAKGDLRS